MEQLQSFYLALIFIEIAILIGGILDLNRKLDTLRELLDVLRTIEKRMQGKTVEHLRVWPGGVP